MRRATVGAGAVLVVVLGVLGARPAPAQEAPDDPPAPGAVLAEVCVESPVGGLPEVGPRLCKSIDSGAVLMALLCAQTPLAPADCAALTDGRDVDPASIDAFEAGWVHRAQRLQARLDEAEPWRRALVPHTHNAGNSTAYDPSVSISDPNQRFSITDQLRMGSRGIELDLHWAFHPTGTVETGGRAVVDCHGTTDGQDDLPFRVHLGCSIDRLAEQNMAEVGEFLRAPGNEREVVLLYLENQLDEDPLAHALAVEAIERTLGDLVARPPGDGCTPMPMDRSRADLLADGHQVLIVGNCGPGAWTGWVHERGPRWLEGSNTAGYPDFPECEAARDARDYEHNFIRTWEDLTWLSAMVGTPSTVTPDEARAMVRCGVNMIGFDRLLPDDGRLEALIWSWARDEPAVDGGRCAAWGPDARFRAAGCAEERPHTCRDGSGTWLVTGDAGAWAQGFASCEAHGATFAVPPTGWDNEELRRAAGDTDPGGLWLNLADTDATGWTPALPAAPPELVDGVEPDPGRPGGGRPPWAPGPPGGPPGPPGGGPPAGPPGTTTAVGQSGPGSSGAVAFAPVSAEPLPSDRTAPAAAAALLLLVAVAVGAVPVRRRAAAARPSVEVRSGRAGRPGGGSGRPRPRPWRSGR